MLIKKIKLFTLIILITTPITVSASAFKTYKVVITNHHFSRLFNFQTKPSLGSEKCELKLDSDIVKLNEIITGEITADITHLCSIIWSTIGLKEDKAIKYNQEISFSIDDNKTNCKSCTMNVFGNAIVIGQDLIEENS